MTTTTVPLIETLNAEQLEAATSTANHTLVIAGPGAGKTRVLAARLVWLLRERNMPSHNILGLVFTRAAAAELRSRVEAEVGEDLAQLLTISTFHSLALRLLRSDESLGFRDLQVASEEEEKEIFDGLFKGPTMRPEARKVGKRKLRAWITKLAAWGSPPEGDRELDLFEIYHARMRQRGLAPYDSLMPGVVGALKGSAVVAQRLSEYRHVLVDEGHDMTPAELILVLGCGGESTVVLDPRQSIYGWRGANIDFAMEFYGEARRITLSQTYRFGSAIAARANDIAEGWGYGEILPAGGADDVVEELPRDKLLGVVTTMAAFLDRENVAVLCRTNRECERVASELGDMAAVVRREEDRSLTAAKALARLVLNNGDDAAFRTLWRVCECFEGDLRAFEREAGHAHGLYAAALRSVGIDGMPDAIRWRQARPHDVPFRDAHAQIGVMGEAAESVADLPLQEALDALAERQDADAFAAIGDRVSVSTIHAAKGREWAGVVFCDFKPRNEEDERVRFVAVTRARRDLCILEVSEEWPR